MTANLDRNRLIIDILLLRVVDAHEGLDGSNHPLGIADEVFVGILRPQSMRQPPQEPRLMQNLAMCPAHGRQSMFVGYLTKGFLPRIGNMPRVECPTLRFVGSSTALKRVAALG